MEGSANVKVLYSVSSNLWKLADFGFSAEGSSKNIVVSTFSRGTPSYRAPELLQETPIFTRKVDIWAVGCIFYEVVTGRKAFKSDWGVREYGLSKEEFEISDLVFLNNGNQEYFFRNTMQITLQRDWAQRPTAKSLARIFSLLLIDSTLVTSRWDDKFQAKAIRRLDDSTNDFLPFMRSNHNLLKSCPLRLSELRMIHLHPPLQSSSSHTPILMAEWAN